MKKVYDTANFYHFIHTVALFAVPLSRKPIVVRDNALFHIHRNTSLCTFTFQTGTLLLSGMALFCGTIYYHALTEEKSLRKFTPYGGMLLIAAWLSMVI
jgi:uncharacterized membrane protein YgdD (TMEM256/DUF423 family)